MGGGAGLKGTLRGGPPAGSRTWEQTPDKKKKKKKKKKKNEKKPFFNFLKKKGNRNFASEFLFPSSSSFYHLLTKITFSFLK
jgi:hypothetical protein